MAENVSLAEKLSKFAKRNAVTLVMVPVLISLHWGWSKLQTVDQFVPKHERKEDIPIVTGIKLIEQKLKSPPKSLDVDSK